MCVNAVAVCVHVVPYHTRRSRAHALAVAGKLGFCYAASWMHFSLAFIPFWLALGGIVACDGDARMREEARAFLSLYESTDYKAPIAERKRRLQALGQLVLVDQQVKRTRDQCLAAHRTLIEAEREQAEAAQALDQAIAGVEPGEPLSSSQTASIKAGIERADRALADARGRFELCEEGARSLALRFGAR